LLSTPAPKPSIPGDFGFHVLFGGHAGLRGGLGNDPFVQPAGLALAEDRLVRSKAFHESIPVEREIHVRRIDRAQARESEPLIEAGRPRAAQLVRVAALLAAPVQEQQAARTTERARSCPDTARAVLDAVSGLPGGGGQVRILEVASLPQIQAALEADEFHVLHLSAHGTATVVELEDEDGAPDPVDAR